MVREGLISAETFWGTINCDGISAERRDLRRDDDQRTGVEDPGPRRATRRFSAPGCMSTARSAPPVRRAAAKPISTTFLRSSSSRRCAGARIRRMRGSTALRRVAKNTIEKRLLNAQGHPELRTQLLRAECERRIRGRLRCTRARTFAVCTEKGPQTLSCEGLLKGKPTD